METLSPSLRRRLVEKWSMVDSMRPLPADILRNLRDSFRTEFTYNTNAMEGNTLTLRETQLVIEEGQTIRGKSLREVYEARNHPEAIGYVESHADARKPLTEHDVLELHQLIIRDTAEREDVGRYRVGAVRISGSSHVPPPAYEVPRLMEGLLRAVNDNPQELTTVELAAYVLHGLAHVHPFRDGNGRMSRLLANLVLMKRRYLPIIILRSDRVKYLSCLARADAGDMRPITTLVAQYEIKHLDMVLSAFRQKPGDAKLTLREAARVASVAPGYLRVLANRGLMPATKDGRNWTVAESDVKDLARKRMERRRAGARKVRG